MSRTHWSWLMTLVACCSFAGAARADSLRCGDRLASSGDSLYQVRATCGDPDDAQQHVERRVVRRRLECFGQGRDRQCVTVEDTVEVVVDEWTYDFGRNRFIEYVTFEQGHLVRVTAGTYGHKD